MCCTVLRNNVVFVLEGIGDTLLDKAVWFMQESQLFMFSISSLYYVSVYKMLFAMIIQNADNCFEGWHYSCYSDL